jgi:hypothetical protein
MICTPHQILEELLNYGGLDGCSLWHVWEDAKWMYTFSREIWCERLLGRSGSRWKDNIEMHFTERRWVRLTTVVRISGFIMWVGGDLLLDELSYC